MIGTVFLKENLEKILKEIIVALVAPLDNKRTPQKRQELASHRSFFLTVCLVP